MENMEKFELWLNDEELGVLSSALFEKAASFLWSMDFYRDSDSDFEHYDEALRNYEITFSLFHSFFSHWSRDDFDAAVSKLVDIDGGAADEK